MTVFLACVVSKLQENEIKSKKRPDMRFSKKPSVHQATQKSHLAKASLTWKEPDKWVIFLL